MSERTIFLLEQQQKIVDSLVECQIKYLVMLGSMYKNIYLNPKVTYSVHQVASTTKSTWKLRLTKEIVILLPHLAHHRAQIHLVASLNYGNAIFLSSFPECI